ncbi:putative phospholipase d1 [Phaeomoniella chlamydospora]|uniref:Phospholipase D1 n=1 Tax=Phaeomoniella chlamydospora TaxID=158046 RepID=A0A0G2EFA2_PHACM|nr:putative phospholipase d1 [Phaeomoniella chlamydospora]
METMAIATTSPVVSKEASFENQDEYPFPPATVQANSKDKTLPPLENGSDRGAAPSPARVTDTTSAMSPDLSQQLNGLSNDGLTKLTPSLAKSPFGRKPTPAQSSSGHIRTLSAEPSLPGSESSPNLMNGTATPPDRRSVQFSRDTVDNEPGEGGARLRPPSLNTDTSEGQGKGKNASFYSKLKALASSPSFTHSKAGAETQDNDQNDGSMTPRSHRFSFPMTLEEEADTEDDADADAESAGEESSSAPAWRRRKSQRRLKTNGAATAPSSPRSPFRPAYQTAQSSAGPEQHGRRRFLPPRRATTDSLSPHGREGVSEDEGRERMKSDKPRRRPGWARGLAISSERSGDEAGIPDDRRPSHLRRLTGFSTPGGDAGVANAWRRHKADRGTSLSAQKWRQIKAQLKLMGQRQRKERTIDHEKSAELLAELMAGSPAALMFASMFQRDLKGHKKIPVLLEQLKVRITDSEIDKHGAYQTANPGDRPTIFRIELEYGNGVNRMRWVIKRSVRDFYELHLAYKGHFAKEKLKLRDTDDKKMPKFPYSAFPYLRTWVKLEEGEDEEEEEEEEAGGNETEAASGTERPGVKKRNRSSFVATRRKSTTPTIGANSASIAGALTGAGGAAGAVGSATIKKETYPERQRRKVEIYLQKMIKFMLFRPDSNRLCRFLEISSLGLRLAAEGSYHGKEGNMIIRSAKGVDFRKVLTPHNFRKRHSPKWFLVRHSYVVCVDSPEEMHIYDVFLFDTDFTLHAKRPKLRHQSPKELASSAKQAAKPQHHRLKLQNSERTMKLLAKNEKLLHQFEESILKMVEQSPWSKENRFQSFAPVRNKCFAQWLVDGRDHMWVVSRAINQAKDVIYIHDWWLSPELYMRRPPAISQRWRLDRLLKRKAEEGVKIFVIMYRNIESAIPIDSGYTKFSLLDLHPNVFVQRSPNQIRQNTFFWAHHEKLCLIDHTVAFVGGIDLCFGRWDTPQHTVVDDKPTGFEDVNMPKDSDHCQLWPGKDYSNPRIQDFFALNKPYEEMYDREEIPRMPWHDISMQVVGQPARDLTRHFVQRWNYILRQRKPTRPTPFLLPPPDFNPADLEALGLDGTCEVQILRSCGPWSIGTTEKVEHSIMTAYCKMIEQSEHFVYIENQFFITSCSTDATRVVNSIGDALVERITRAAKNNEAWRAVIVIPLMPGFQNTVAEPGGTSVRLIMQYQYRSICRGESSIFGRLRAQGISPEDYIQFFSLRNWGMIGPKKMLVTEQLYIHAKCMVVDDRVAIIGSANINERSMLGSRDSECAAIVRDTDMIWSRMDGKKYLVGRFPHTLRMRLMREHLGLDVDEIMEQTPPSKEPALDTHDKPLSSSTQTSSAPNGSPTKGIGGEIGRSAASLEEGLLDRSENIPSFNHDVDWEQAENPNLKSNRRVTEDPRVMGNQEHRKDVIGHGADHMAELEQGGLGIGRNSAVVEYSKEVLVSDLASEGRGSLSSPKKRGESTDNLMAEKAENEANPAMPPRPSLPHMTTSELGLPMLSQLPALPEIDDSDIGGPHPAGRRGSEPTHPLLSELILPRVDQNCMKDPLLDTFYLDTWQAVAENNTKIYRAVFRCMPDNEVRDWKSYNEYVSYDARFKEMQGASGDWKPKNPQQSGKAAAAKQTTTSGPPGAAMVEKNPALAAAELPQSAQQKAGELKNKILSVVGEGNGDSIDAEQARLRQWAAELNRAQFERQDKEKELQERQNSRGSQDEKQGLSIPHTVPESSEAHFSGAENGSTGTAEHTNGSSTAYEDGGNQPLSPSLPKASAEPYVGYSEALNMNYNSRTQPRRRRATTKSSRPGVGSEFMASQDIPTHTEAEKMLSKVQGHLIAWPYDWLDKVEAGGNWLFAKDNLTPLEIYI